jgi:hypothetical protein
MALVQPDAFLHHGAASSSSTHFGDAFSDWLARNAAVPPSWRGARVHCTPQVVSGVPTLADEEEYEEEEEPVVVSKLTLDDCAVGDWVEVCARYVKQPARAASPSQA